MERSGLADRKSSPTFMRIAQNRSRRSALALSWQHEQLATAPNATLVRSTILLYRAVTSRTSCWWSPGTTCSVISGIPDGKALGCISDWDNLAEFVLRVLLADGLQCAPYSCKEHLVSGVLDQPGPCMILHDGRGAFPPRQGAHRSPEHMPGFRRLTRVSASGALHDGYCQQSLPHLHLCLRVHDDLRNAPQDRCT